MTNQSYIRVLTILELFAKEHLQIKRFASDFPEQLPNFSSESEQYPILFVSPNNSVFKQNQNTFDLTIYCYDLIQDGRGNINTILSDTNTILNDLYLWLRDGEVGGLEVLNDINCTPINNSLLDYVAGWQMTLSIEVDTYNVCEIPFNEEPAILDVVNNIIYSKYLTCETLSDCSTIIDIENELSSLTDTVNGFEQSIIDNTESINQLEEDINQLDITLDNVLNNGNTSSNNIILTDNDNFEVTIDKEYVEISQYDGGYSSYLYIDAYNNSSNMQNFNTGRYSYVENNYYQVYLEYNRTRGLDTANYIKIDDNLEVRSGGGDLKLTADKFESRIVYVTGHKVGLKTGFYNFGYLATDNLSSERTYQFPDASGTVSLTSDLDTKISKSTGPTYTTNAILSVTQAEYDAIITKDPNTLYFIV